MEKERIKLSSLRRKRDVINFLRRLGIPAEEEESLDSLREKLRKYARDGEDGHFRGTVADKVIRFLKENEGWHTIEDIAKAIGERPKSVKNRIYIERGKGLVESKVVTFFRYRKEG